MHKWFLKYGKCHMLIGKEDQPDKLNQNSTEIASFDLFATKLGQNSVFL